MSKLYSIICSSFSFFHSFIVIVVCFFLCLTLEIHSHTHSHTFHLPFAKNAMAKILKQYFKICLAFSRSGELVFCPCSLPEPPTNPASPAPVLPLPCYNSPLFICCLPANFICLHVRLHVVFLFSAFLSSFRSRLWLFSNFF